MSRGRQADSEDLFADTRMSFGEHIEELRWHLVRAIAGFAIIVHLVFILDFIGSATGTRVGVGKPMLEFIEQPVKDSLREYSKRRKEKALDEIKDSSKGEMLNAPQEMDLLIDVNSLADTIARKLKISFADQAIDDETPNYRKIRVKVAPYDIAGLSAEATQDIQNRYGLRTLSPTEAMFVYIKVAFVCGLVLSSPWVFWQIWSFIAAGLFQHEKKYIFAIMLPLVFGISFQTPLVMLFLERLGFVSIETYRSKRIYAYFGLGFFGALVNPSADLISQFFLLIPLFLLYELGIWLCKLTAKPESDIDVPESEEMVEV